MQHQSNIPSDSVSSVMHACMHSKEINLSRFVDTRRKAGFRMYLLSIKCGVNVLINMVICDISATLNGSFMI